MNRLPYTFVPIGPKRYQIIDDRFNVLAVLVMYASTYEVHMWREGGEILLVGELSMVDNDYMRICSVIEDRISQLEPGN